jgi:hypothetical protein
MGATCAVWRLAWPISSAPHGLFDVASAANAYVPQGSVIEFLQGSDNLLDFPLAAPLR